MFNSYYSRLLTIAFGETEKMERLIKLIINLKKKFSTMLYELLSKKTPLLRLWRLHKIQNKN
jgi:hypothetical protein